MTTKTVNPYKTTLDSGNAYWMARLAGLAYTRKADNDATPDREAILANLKAEDPQFLDVFGFSSNTAQAILVEHQNFITFAFRGTDERGDWLDNLNVFSTKVLFGEFHRGFWQSTEDIWQPLWDCYEQRRIQKKRPLFLTGHSLGGAMAAIAAAKLIHADLPFISAYTFGQPRTMTVETARIFNIEAKTRFFRFQNNNDIVTRVPARLMNYSHVGSYFYISPKPEQKIYNDIGFWYRFLDTVEGAIDAIPEKGLDGVEDHSMSHYLAAVTKWDCAF